MSASSSLTLYTIMTMAKPHNCCKSKEIKFQYLLFAARKIPTGLTTQDVWGAAAMSLVQRIFSAITLAVSVAARTTPMVTSAMRVWITIMAYQTRHVKV